MRPFPATSATRSYIGSTPSGASLVAQPSILLDGRTSGADNAGLWDTAGSGTATSGTVSMDLSVGAGEYLVRQTRRRTPYFSGYPLLAELTFDSFGIEAGVLKRIGYFSSSTSAPYTAGIDGFCIEMDGLTYRLKAWNNGTITVNVPLADWEDRGIQYDFEQFSAIAFDFLWLGGAALRLWICTAEGGWQIAAIAPFIGRKTGTMTASAQQPLRYEIRSSTGTGAMTAICCQTSVVGDVSDKGYNRLAVSSTGVSCNSIGTTYALQGSKLSATYLEGAVEIVDYAALRGNVGNDSGMLLLLKNPTLSAPLTYAATGQVQTAYATTQTVTALGTIVAAVPMVATANTLVDGNYGRWMTRSITGTPDEYVLAYRPASTNQTLYGVLTVKEH